MYARTAQRPKQRQSQLKMFPAPIGGWISNRALAIPNDGSQPPGAAILDNFFPRATSVQLRRGKLLYCTLGNGTEDATSLFSYNNGANKRLFASTPSTIYDITEVAFPYEVEITDEDDNQLVDENGNWFGWYSTEFSDVMGGFTGGDWIVVQFATTGGVYLIGVNGKDIGFIYDGDQYYPNVQGGVYRLLYENETAEFTEGAVLTGGTSGATATIWKIIPDEGSDTGALLLTDLAGGPFQSGESLSDNEGGAADADGVEDIAVPGVEFPDGLTTADMSYVWVYKNRVWFAQKETMNAWYLDVDSIGGEATIFPLAGIFPKGGALLFGYTWSLEGGAEGGLSEQCIFASSEGEVAVYQGISPEEADTWAKVGTYRIGTPLGNRAFVRGGGDLAISTSVGLVPLSKAIELDITSLNVATVSYNIADAWADAVSMRGLTGWQAEIWPENKMAVFAPPTAAGLTPVIFVSNTETGAWARYTGWEANCLEAFAGKLYFGSSGGKVFIANATGQDDGQTYTGAMLPLYDDFGSPASIKTPTVGRVVARASAEIDDQVQWRADYDLNLPSPPNATGIPAGASIWGVGVWGESVWGAETPQFINQRWRSISGLGYAGSLAFQVTSGSEQPLDVDVVRLEALYSVAEMVS